MTDNELTILADCIREAIDERVEVLDQRIKAQEQTIESLRIRVDELST